MITDKHHLDARMIRKTMRNLSSIVVVSVAFVAGFVLHAAFSFELAPEAPEMFRRKEGQVVISVPGLGRVTVDGAQDLLEPVVEQGRRMNKIEALENHNQFEHLSPNPEDYVR